MNKLTNIGALDRATVIHPFTNLKDYAAGKLGDPTVVESGSGVRITVSTGKTYIDGFAGLYCMNIGYGRTEVAEAIPRQAHKLVFYHSYAAHTTDELAILSDRLVCMAPGRMSKVFYGMSGSDANETNAKLVSRQYVPECAAYGKRQRKASRLKNSNLIRGPLKAISLTPWCISTIRERWGIEKNSKAAVTIEDAVNRVVGGLPRPVI